MASDNQKLLHLLRLVSPTLPIGAFSYSRGLESAVHRGFVTNEEQARYWIFGTLEHSFAHFDAPLFLRMAEALGACDAKAFLAANDWLRAGRESLELQMEDRLLGDALHGLLSQLGISSVQQFADHKLTFPAGFALACNHWAIEPRQALRGLFWVVVEGQVTAALRLVPLGQTAGQRIMIGAVDLIEACAAIAEHLPDAEIGNTAIGLAMASAWHENQYSRLFRS
jgi:urease accessory protein